MDRSTIWAASWAIALVFLATRMSVGQDAIGIDVAIEVAEEEVGQGGAEMKARDAAQKDAKEKDDDSFTTTEPFILRLSDGDYVAGKLTESPAGRGIVWQSPAFQEALRFPYERVNAIVSSSPEVKAPALSAMYRLELNGGDVLFGDLVSLDKDRLVLAESDSRRIEIATSAMRKLSRIDGGPGVECVGVGLFKDWKTSGPKNGWREDAGVMFSKSVEGVARRSVGFHRQSRVEVQLSWKSKPRFVIALMDRPGDTGETRGYRLEAWREQIVLIRESAEGASVAVVQAGLPESGEMAVQVLIDDEKGQAFVVANDGRKLAELTVPSNGETKPARIPKGKVNRIFAGQDLPAANSENANSTAPNTQGTKSKDVGSDIVLMDFSSGVRLETLRVSQWTGTMDAATDAASKFAVRTIDGRRYSYDSLELEPNAKNFRVHSSEGSAEMSPLEVKEIVRQPDPDDGAGRSFVAQMRTGARISGELERVDDRHVWLKRPGLPEAYPCEIQSLIAIKRVTPIEKAKEAITKPRLELDGVVLHGQLTDSAAGSPLRWQAEGCEESVSLHKGLSGRVVLRERPPPAKTAARAPQGPGMVTQVTRFFGLGRAPSGPKNPTSANPALVHLREGDVISCRVKHMSERGVEIESTLIAATFIPQDKIRVVELDPKAPAIGIPKDKKERLLLLPRAQRNNAPTHLIRSTRGDYLRGRLVDLDESKLTVELRLETQVIPVDRVARVIWLHKDETTSTNTPAPKPTATGLPGERAQVVFPDGNRLSFQVESFAEGTLHGTSSLLGAIHAKMEEVDRILFGTAIDKEASELPFHSWKMKAAPDPLDVTSDSSSDSGSVPGSESPLVGKPAPDISLDLLDGSKFELKKLRGKVVVLDFWATWCGPCLRSTPLIEKVVGEAGDDVQLIAVNLQETPTKIQKMLDRLELKLTTALDKDGLIAEKYGATSIPHIVVIDREGVVARVYEGVSSDFEQKLRTALKTVAGGKPEGDKPAETSATPSAKNDEVKNGDTAKDAAG
jgi:thiol-disulfide isomerase/thioredoxin